MPAITYNAKFTSEVSLSTKPSASLTNRSDVIPAYAIIERINFRVYCGVSSYNSDLDAEFTIWDANGSSWNCDKSVSTGSSNRIWAEWGDKPNVTLDWNNLKTVQLDGTSKLTIRPDYTANLIISYSMPTPLGDPSNLKADPASSSPTTNIRQKALLSWTASAAGANNPVFSYQVEKSTDGSNFSSIGFSSYAVFEVDVPTENGGVYWFRVRAISQLGNDYSSGYSNVVQVKTEYTKIGTPGTPQILGVNYGPPGEPVEISWNAAADGVNNPVAFYEIYRRIDGGSEEIVGTSGTANAYIDAPTINGQAYTFAVRAVCELGLEYDSDISGYSDPLYCSFTAPTAPSNLLVDGELSVYREARQKILLTWAAGDSGENNPLEGYHIFRDDVFVGETAQTSFEAEAYFRYGATVIFTVRTKGKYSLSPESNGVSVTTNIPSVPPRSTEAVSSFLFFDKDDNLLFLREDAISLKIVEEEFKCTGSFPYNPEKIITHGMRIGWLEAEEFLMFEIRQPKTDPVSMIQSFEGEHIAISELWDEIIEDKRPYDTTAEDAVIRALEGTPWMIGNVTASDSINSTNYYFENVWKALLKVRDTWGVVIKPRLLYTYNGIERFIDVLDRMGQNRGVRLTLNLNVQQAGVTYDDRELFTALYGCGSSTGDGERKLTFEDAYWSVNNGDPAEKPSGQKWVEDVEATAAFGRKGRKRTGVVEFETLDPFELLRLTWDALQKMKIPKITIVMTAFDLSSIGYSAQGLAWGDDVVVVLDDINVEVQARINQYTRDVLYPEDSVPVIGDYRSDLVFKFSNLE